MFKDDLAAELREFRRPWKLATLAVGIGLLLAGSWYYGFADWSVGISLLMGGMSYLFAPWSVRVFIRRQWACAPIALFLFWLTVDGVYVGYNELFGNWYVREANFTASACLYGLCAFIWLPRGSLHEIFVSRSARF